MFVKINVPLQKLSVYQDQKKLCSYLVSTAAKGTGQENGSEQTPLGKHVIHEKIGGGAPINSVFVGRQPTGEIYSLNLAKTHPERDWILTRILWLAGMEPNKNQGGSVDTLSRYIYIHGAPDTVKIGVPTSHGCVRMRNQDVVELFDLIPIGTEVIIDARK